MIVYRFFFQPDVDGWPDKGCPGCSLMADQIAHLAHLNARDTTLVFVSRAEQEGIARLKKRMGWDIPWYTITDTFDADFGVDEWHGTNAFLRDGWRPSSAPTSSTTVATRGWARTWAYLDITALGRQEDWEDSPAGYPQTAPVPMVAPARRVPSKPPERPSDQYVGQHHRQRRHQRHPRQLQRQ